MSSLEFVYDPRMPMKVGSQNLEQRTSNIHKPKSKSKQRSRDA
jgi:hypothetical protein